MKFHENNFSDFEILTFVQTSTQIETTVGSAQVCEHAKKM